MMNALRQRLAREERDLFESGALLLTEAKSGYKTTEFWTALVGSALINLNVIPLPDRFKGWVTAGLLAAYAISRGLAKAGVPTVEDTKKV